MDLQTVSSSCWEEQQEEEEVRGEHLARATLSRSYSGSPSPTSMSRVGPPQLYRFPPIFLSCESRCIFKDSILPSIRINSPTI